MNEPFWSRMTPESTPCGHGSLEKDKRRKNNNENVCKRKKIDPQGGLHRSTPVGPIPPDPPPLPVVLKGGGGVTTAPSPQTPLPKNSTSAEGGGAERTFAIFLFIFPAG